MSVMADFYRSSSFATYRKVLEGKQKLSLAFLERMDGIAKQIGGLGGTIAKMMQALGRRH